MNKNVSILIIILVVAGLIIFATQSSNGVDDTQDTLLDDTTTMTDDDSDSYGDDDDNDVDDTDSDDDLVPVVEAPATSTPTPETPSSSFTLNDVANHATAEDCYTAINGLVYDLTAWVDKHPGGDKNILKICGIDGTSAYMGQHGNNKEALGILEGFEIGTLQ